MRTNTRFVLSLLAGVILGCLLIGATALYPLGQFTSASNSPRFTSGISSASIALTTSDQALFTGRTIEATTSTASQVQTTPPTVAVSVPYSSIDELTRQGPSSLTVLLPIVAAFLFGLAVYRSSLAHEGGKASSS